MRKVKYVESKQIDEKVLSVVGSICSISIIILACIQIFGIWENAIDVLEPFLGLLMLIQAIRNWKKNKVVAIVSLCAAIFILGVSIFIFVIR